MSTHLRPSAHASSRATASTVSFMGSTSTRVIVLGWTFPSEFGPKTGRSHLFSCNQSRASVQDPFVCVKNRERRRLGSYASSVASCVHEHFMCRLTHRLSSRNRGTDLLTSAEISPSERTGIIPVLLRESDNPQVFF